MNQRQERAVAAAVVQEPGAGQRLGEPASHLKARPVAPGHDSIFAVELLAGVSAAGEKLVVCQIHIRISFSNSLIQAVTRRTCDSRSNSDKLRGTTNRLTFNSAEVSPSIKFANAWMYRISQGADPGRRHNQPPSRS